MMRRGFARPESVQRPQDARTVVRMHQREPRSERRWRAERGIDTVQAKLLGRPCHRIGGAVPFPGADAGGFLREAQAVADGFDGFARILRLAPGQHAVGCIARGDQDEPGGVRVRDDVEIPPCRGAARTGSEPKGPPGGASRCCVRKIAGLGKEVRQGQAGGVAACAGMDLPDPGGVGRADAAIRRAGGCDGAGQGFEDPRQNAPARGVCTGGQRIWRLPQRPFSEHGITY